MPKIVVPLVAKTHQEIFEDSRKILDSKPDLVEWRADFFVDVLDTKQLLKTSKMIKEVFSSIPIIFTIRTSTEGGNLEVDTNTYFHLIETVASDSPLEMIDIELFRLSDSRLVELVHKAGKLVIISNHDFHKTPEKQEIISRLTKMQVLGADLLKIAVMPNSNADVITLLDATNEMANTIAEKPLVTMAMGSLGAITRVIGEFFGSALSFACVGKTSAPGQMPIEALRTCLETLHKSIQPCK